MDRRIVVAHDKKSILAENGPMRMVIQAWEHGRFDIDLAVESARFAFICLEQVAAYRSVLMFRNPEILHNLAINEAPLPLSSEAPIPLNNEALIPLNNEAPIPLHNDASIPLNMVKSVLAFAEPDLTPMAAVAGSMADAVADWLFNRGMTRVIVDNGGDIAIRLSGSETARVGIRTDINCPVISHVMVLDARHASWGVNTSGLGGRSLTRGIASAVTVLAESSSMADAAATALANACFVEDEGIMQVPAEKLDPGTDIPGIPVTVQVGNLKPDTVTRSLESSLTKAEAYVKQGLIHGALIAAGGREVLTRRFAEKLSYS